MSEQLKEADIEIMSRTECTEIWYSEAREDVNICITSPDVDKGSCDVSYLFH